MKKVLATLMSVALAAFMFINLYTPADAAGYKAQVIVESYSVPDDITLGENTTVSVKITNMDQYYPVSNLTVTWTSSGNTIIPSEGHTNQVYVGVIRAGASVTIDIPCVVVRTDYGYASMQLGYEYLSDEARFTNNASLVFTCKEVEIPSVAIKNVNVPEKAALNSNSLVSVSFSNTTGEEMYNTQLVVGGDVRGGEVITKIGAVAVNKPAYSEAYVNFVSDGTKSLTMKLVYENRQGETFEEIVGDYIVNVTEYQAMLNDTNVTPVNDGVMSQVNLSVVFLGAAAAILLIIVIVFVINLIRKRR